MRLTEENRAWVDPVFKIWKIVNVSALILHYLICFSIFIIIETEENESFQFISIKETGKEESHTLLMKQYLQMMYFLVTTFSSVGYGDFTIEFTYLNLFPILVSEIIGLGIFFPYFIGGLINGFLRFKEMMDRIKDEREAEEDWLNHLERLNPKRGLNTLTDNMSKRFLYLRTNMRRMDFRPVLESEFFNKSDPHIRRRVDLVNERAERDAF